MGRQYGENCTRLEDDHPIMKASIEALKDPIMSPEVYYDIPGNHDQYGDGSLFYYLESSMQGRATGSTQQAWFLTYGKIYEFISVCNARNDGKPWLTDNAGLDQKSSGR